MWYFCVWLLSFSILFFMRFIHILACLRASFLFTHHFFERQHYVEERLWISEACQCRAGAKVCHFLGMWPLGKFHNLYETHLQDKDNNRSFKALFHELAGVCWQIMSSQKVQTSSLQLPQNPYFPYPTCFIKTNINESIASLQPSHHV